MKAKEVIEILELADPDAEVILGWDATEDPIPVKGVEIRHPMQVFIYDAGW